MEFLIGGIGGVIGLLSGSILSDKKALNETKKLKDESD